MFGPVVVEDNVRFELSSSQRDREAIGVLVGRVTSKDVFVLRFVATPVLEESHGIGNNGLPSEEWWVEDHAHQVWDMLPGGLSVVGLCLVSQSFGERAGASLHKLTRHLCKPRALLPSYLLPYKLLIVHFSTVTECLTCQYLDPHDTVGCARPVDVVFRCLADSWCHLESTVPVQVETLVPLSTQDPLLEAYQKLITSFDLWQCGIILVRDRHCDKDELMEKYVERGCIQCTLFPKRKVLECGQSRLVENAAAMTVSGTAAVIAYVPLKATMTEASEALGGDVVQTVTVRWRRMCEDLQFHQQQKQLTGTWCQPQRVQLAVKGWMFHLCAYHFPEETEQDLCERVCEVFGVDVQNMSIVRCEQGPLVERLLPRTPRATSVSWLVVMIAAALLLAVLAALLCTSNQDSL